MNHLDQLTARAQNNRVPFNIGAGRENPNRMADSRRTRHFLRPSHTIGASFSMASRGGNTFGYAGSILPVSHIPPCACHPDREKSAASLTLRMEATMPSITLRTICTLIPATIARRLAYRLYLRRTITATALVRILGVTA